MKILDIFTHIHTGGADIVAPSGLPMPLIIAEAGVNHEGSMEIAKRLIDEACEGGAHAVKFQSYKAATLASKNSPAYWDTSKEPTASQYELFRRHDKFWKTEFEILKRHCDATGIEFMSTPFDVESSAFLNDLMDVVKISSSDITNKPFIRHLCAFGKPIILSTGASYPYEIMEAVSWIEASGTPLALLHCVLNYPTPDENAGLGMISALRSLFPHLVIGYSDHTLPGDMRVLETAALLGARILEKHFTHDKSLPGNDHYHAMDKKDLRRFVEAMQLIRSLVGASALTSLPSEEPARRHARRSLVAARRIPAGTIIGKGDLTWKRPAHGISPRNYDEVLGMKARTDIAEDSVLQWALLE
ncbi:MAG: N-acetylneuraminate synthase family protein [Desulfovibrio sp.]|jgi:N-acetylneuraminate synthase|nr:N-acetylneuraminate synthase family protein [Desulfovibrio sp.]